MSCDLFFYTSSDDEDEVNSELVVFAEACQAAYEASKPKIHRTPLEKDHYGAHDRLVMAYFSENPQYNEKTFRERFRMSRRLFTKIVREVTDASQFFQERYDCTGQRSISVLMKCTFAVRQLAYGCVPDSLDEYLQIVRQLAYGCVPDSLDEYLQIVAFKAQFCRGDHGPDPFILLEAIASNDLRIWHAFFANDVSYKRGYYLTDGIYPQWSVLIKSIKNPGTNDHKRILYKTKHEAAWKDVKRAFGVLKKKWKIIKYSARGLTQSRLSDIMVRRYVKIISEEQHRADDPVRTHAESMQFTQEIIDRTTHLSLKADLVEHIWNNAN
nr:hypothetical protein [Tanacetum cinerariifolium]